MSEFRFQHFELLHLYWLLPGLVLLFVLVAVFRKRALAKLIDSGLLGKIRISASGVRRSWKAILYIVAIAFLIFGAARPGWNPKPKKVERSGRDVVFLLDVSRSMLAEDLAPNRLERAKLAISDAVNKLAGDRVGLVIFSGSSVVQCPLTLDYGFFKMRLEEVTTESIAKGGTMIGDALRKVLTDVFDDQNKEYRDVVLITDGEDHESFPVQAAESAGEQDVRLIAIGLGDENEGRRIPITDERGNRTFLTYNGREVWSRLDADTLRKMVNSTPGGKYLNVSTGAIDLGEVYQQLIATAEKRKMESTTIKDYDERFQIFFAIAVLLLAVEWVISDRSRMKNG